MRLVRQLGREDWIAAGATALATRGAPGFRVEAVARSLGVSKGSFYWHFRDRNAWRDAVLGWWEHRIYEIMVLAHRRSAEAKQAMQGGDLHHCSDGSSRAGPRRRSRAGSDPGQEPGVQGRDVVPAGLECALRLWAREDIGVALCLQRIAAERRRSATGASAAPATPRAESSVPSVAAPTADAAPEASRAGETPGLAA